MTRVQSALRPITAGFTLIGRGNWTGGETYLRNMLGMIKGELSGNVAPKLFLSQAQAAKLKGSLDPFLVCPPIIDEVFADRGRGTRLARALALGSDRDAERVFKANGVDVVFESATFYGHRFGLPVVSWIPDFQHRHLPHLFTKPQWWRRDAGFRAQIATNRTIMLSSDNAREDCERFYPASRGKIKVVKFAIDFDPARHVARHAEITATYALPDRFFYLPNQFWKHKNHGLVVDALSILKSEGKLDAMPPVVLTGRTDDPRNPKYFDELMQSVQSRGLATDFRYLGLLPYDDVFGLAGSCDAMINPSLFEGWSTTVEEAKGLGCRMLLSDIAIHREQAPDASFFSASDPNSLAQVLLSVAIGRAFVRENTDKLLALQHLRRSAYASSLLETFSGAIRRGAPLWANAT
jgi:glycosyltransferase involved in cell wall biosynthesis